MNSLHAALVDAAHEAAKRPAFYHTLMHADVFVIGHTDQPTGEGHRTLEAGDNLSLVNWEKADGTPVIPFFTHLEALQCAVDSETRYLALPARNLFEMTRGATLFLNPKSDYGKEFLPHEIEALLETGMNQRADSRTVEKETRVMLGQPAEYPQQMVSALKQLLGMHPGVIAAYLCLMHYPDSEEAPVLLVGFEGVDLEQAMREAGSVVADTAPDGQPVDFVLVDDSTSGLSAYLRGTEPFYSWAEQSRGRAQ
ncbi:MAG: enhanced serine sensitivity protein SseB C-terminal domain-containing protein [Pseudomonadota bacterium]|nr:enhanced serine sensitivity protein SseB C-terminal domain-containing protein [Pseudomonadota bacterium]MEE3319110.1 enhanced serine sensitivity protein SseB C-terminal domain-containing protein [Pseudomonadota bacterium]